MNKKKILDLLSEMKEHIAEIELQLSQQPVRHESENIFKSKRHDKYCTWFMKIRENTFESMRSSLSRINKVEQRLKVDLTKMPLQKFDDLIERINIETFPKNAFGTIDNYKTEVRNYNRFRKSENKK